MKSFIYILLADVIFLVHLSLVLVVALGWISPSLYYLFLVLIFLTFLSEIFLGYCVLSAWEFGLRRKIYPEREYDTSCIMHYGRALFGLRPRQKDNIPKTFFSKHSFLFMLAGLLVLGTGFHFYFS